MLRKSGTQAPAERRILTGASAAAMLLIAVVASLPISTLVGVVPDDAFYYLVVGRNLASTGVSTFDGENLASGYHPAWMVLTTAVAKVFPGNDTLLRTAVAMSLLLHIVAGWLVYRCLKRFLSGTAAALVASFWLFGYLPLVIASFALETSLYCVAFLLSYLAYLAYIEPHLRRQNTGNQERIPTTSLLVFGAALGFCLWARTEAVVLLTCALAWIGIAALQRQSLLRSLAEACRRAILTGGTAMVVISPWLAYCLHNFGTVRQASGVMKMLWMQDEVVGLSAPERLWLYVYQFGQWLAYSLPWAWGSSVGMALAMASAWLILFAVVGIYLLRSRKESRHAVAQVLPSIAYPLMHLLAAGALYGSCFADVAKWYLALPYLECYLVLAILGGAIYRAFEAEARARHWPAKALAVATVFTILGLVRYVQTWQQGYWAWQRDVYAVIERMDDVVPEHTRIGAFNAGIPGYFSRRQIINLDGLVNEAVVPYWKARQFDRYLSDADIRVIFDEKLSMARAEHFSQGLPPLRELVRCHLTNYIIDTRYVWSVDLSGARRPSPESGRHTPSAVR
jgi:hypothetical protein